MRTQTFDCACCDHASDCNASRVPAKLRFTIATSAAVCDHTRSVFLTWAATGCNPDPGWVYGGGDTAICASATDFGLRAVNLCCDSGWKMTVTVVNSGVQDALANPSTFTNLVTNDDNPIDLEASHNGNYLTGCGNWTPKYYVQHVNSIAPACGQADMPSTLTLQYSIAGISGSVSVSKHSFGYFNNDFLICDVGDGHTSIRGNFSLDHDSVKWVVGFSMRKYVDGVGSSAVSWDPPQKTIGQVYADTEATCRPYHFVWEGTNTSGNVSGGSSLSCGGHTYPFSASAGAIDLLLVLDE